QVAPALRRIPEMMVRIDDRQRRFQRFLARTLGQPRRQLGVVAIRQPAVFAFCIPGHVIPCHGPIAVAIVIPAKARIKSGGVNLPPESTSQAVQLTWARQPRGRQDLATGAWRTARAGLTPPVPPVLSGRDQAAATPQSP